VSRASDKILKSCDYIKSLELSGTKDFLKSPPQQKKPQKAKTHRYKASKIPESMQINLNLLIDKTEEKKPDEATLKAEAYLKELDDIYKQLTTCIKENQKEIFRDDNIAAYLNNLKAFAKGTYTLLKDFKGNQ